MRWLKCSLLFSGFVFCAIQSEVALGLNQGTTPWSRHETDRHVPVGSGGFPGDEGFDNFVTRPIGRVIRNCATFPVARLFSDERFSMRQLEYVMVRAHAMSHERSSVSLIFESDIEGRQMISREGGDYYLYTGDIINFLNLRFDGDTYFESISLKFRDRLPNNESAPPSDDCHRCGHAPRFGSY